MPRKKSARRTVAKRSRRISAGLKRAYIETSYYVRIDGRSLVIRIGKMTDELRAALKAHRCRGFAFITAWNPGSRKLSRRENDLRHGALVRALKKKRLRVYVGWGRGADGKWAEKSVFVPGMRLRDAVAIGSRFG